MDPILQYLIEFNEKHSIEYKGRFLIPVGGLAQMLDKFQGYHLNKEIVIKELIKEPEPDPGEATIDELYNLLEE